MRIGISTSVAQGGKTGIAHYLLGLVRGLVAHASRHEFVLFVLEADWPLFSFARQHMQMVPVPESMRNPVRDIAWHQTVLPRLARQFGLDVLHVPSYRRMLLPRPCPLVATIHDLAQFHVRNKYDWKRMLYGRLVARRLAHRQDCVIAISRNTVADIRRFFDIDEKRIFLVYNGLDHSCFKPEPTGAARAHVAERFDLRTPYFLYVARLEHPAKNHLLLFEAFNRFKQETGSPWQLVLAGSDWHGAEAIHQARARSPYAADIRSLGFVPEDSLPSLYQAASAFLYPSLYEGFGMPPLEAMACACPVISSNGGSLAEVVGDGGVLLDPSDAPGWASQLARLAVEPTYRELLRIRAVCRAGAFSWEQTARQTCEIYMRAFAGRGTEPVAFPGVPAGTPPVASPQHLPKIPLAFGARH